MRRLGLHFSVLVLAGGCGNSFDPESHVDSVRVMAVQASPPYALPGETVNLSALAYDGRASQPEPMVLSWLQATCENPAGDDYYACYPAFANEFRPGVNLDDQLVQGSQFSFQMPSDVISTHSLANGEGAYGLVVVFMIACAGHVEYTPPRAGAAPDAVPFGCFDSSEVALGADDFVFAFEPVYSFTDRTNANPVVSHLTFGGVSVDPDAGITVPICAASNSSDCPGTAIDTIVPASSQEVDPSVLGPSGAPLKEELWVDYFVTAGTLKDDAVVLYDPKEGRLPNTGDDFAAPSVAGESILWAVVHDDRGGVSWAQVPVHAQ